MPKLTGTATEFILNTLRELADRELQVSELHTACNGKFSKENLTNSLARMLAQGTVVKSVDANRAAWWAISDRGLTGLTPQ